MQILPSIFSILLFFNIGTLLICSLSENEYLIENHRELISDDEEVRFRSLTKRESEPIPVILKKPTNEKKVPVKLLTKEKESLKENGTEPVSAETPKPTELLPKVTKPPTSEVLNTTTELPDLPSDLPKGFNLQDDEGNTTQHFIYYNATFYNETAAKNLWVDLESLALEKVTKHLMLSSSHRRASTVSLPFDFPFYGHKIRNITIATGGFLYTGDYMHTWLAATQYIAPLMANFDTSIHNESTIKYADCGDNFTVQWEKVYLQDKTQGPFTFQVTLHKSGDIAFVYQTVPISIKEINDEHHPVKVGLSDAYIIEKTVVFIRRKTIYEYHRADVSHFDIQNNTSIYFTALPTCQNYSDCDSCMGADNRFECLWCDSIGRCSSGLDRHRQDWINAKCEDLKPTDIKCKAPIPEPAFQPTKPTKKPSSPSSVPPATSTNITSNATSSSESTVSVTTYATASVPPKLVTLRPDKKGQYMPAARISDEDEQEEAIHKSSVGAGAVIAILMIICSVLGFAVWIGYAYKYPQSPSGQLLIRYRPSQWRWRHGEARYTAASIHI